MQATAASLALFNYLFFYHTARKSLFKPMLTIDVACKDIIIFTLKGNNFLS